MRSWLVVLGTLFLTGCGGMDIESFRGQTPEFRLESYFQGQTRAWGWFEDRFGRIQRRMVVDITGTVDGDTLTLDESFVWSDGVEERRVWTIRSLGDGRYEGRADDVQGTALGRVVGPALNWSYDLSVPMGERSVVLHFDDWMIQEDADTVINRASVSKWGFNVGTVVIFFQKVQASSADADTPPYAFNQAAE